MMMRLALVVAVFCAVRANEEHEEEHIGAGVFEGEEGEELLDLGEMDEDGEDEEADVPNVHVLTAADDLDAFDDPTRTYTTVIAFFTADESTRETLSLYDQVAASFAGNFLFGAIFDDASIWASESAKHSLKEGFNIIVQKPPPLLVKSEGTGFAKWTGTKLVDTEDGAALHRFIFENSIPLVGERQNGDSNYMYMWPKYAAVTVFAPEDVDADVKTRSFYSELIAPVAEAHKDIQFVVTPSMEFAHFIPHYIHTEADAHIVDGKNCYFGIDQLTPALQPEGSVEDEPAEPIITNFGESVPKFSTEALEDFVQRYKAGKLAGKVFELPTYDDEPEEEEVDHSEFVAHVPHVTPDDLTKIANNDPADTFTVILLYAPWCGHCTAMKPAYMELVTEFKDNAKVKIVAMDADANTPPEKFPIEGFPTIYTVAAGGGVPQDYDGGRDFEDLVELVKEKTQAK